jgi:hypothetical protein
MYAPATRQIAGSAPVDREDEAANDAQQSAVTDSLTLLAST